MILGVILAGGLATRMGGGDKGLKSVAGMPILTRVATRIGPQVERLIINANGDPERFVDFELPVIADDLPDRPGPLAGVLAGAASAGMTLNGKSLAPRTPMGAPRPAPGKSWGRLPPISTRDITPLNAMAAPCAGAAPGTGVRTR